MVAAGSLPPGFPAKEVAGRFYWDGGLWSNTPLPEVLNALQADPAEEPLWVNTSLTPNVLNWWDGTAWKTAMAVGAPIDGGDLG